MPFNPKWIIGRTIVDVEMNHYDRGAGYSHRQGSEPVLVLDSGARVAFLAEENDGDTYGTHIIYRKPERKR